MPRPQPTPPDPDDPDVLYSLPDSAGRLGCSTMHVYRLIAAGELEAVDIAVPGATRSKSRIRGSELARYIARKAGQAAAKSA